MRSILHHSIGLLVHVIDVAEVRAHFHGVLELLAVTERAPKEEGPPSNAPGERVGVGVGVHGEGEVVKQRGGRGEVVKQRGFECGAGLVGWVNIGALGRYE